MTFMIPKKPKNPFFKFKSLDHLPDTSIKLINYSTGITSPPPFYTKRPNLIDLSLGILV